MLTLMNDAERSVYAYLLSQGFNTIVYEPDGMVPPDFLVNGRIAVEVRRLNQNEETATGHRGLEEVAKPLNALVHKALAAMGPPIGGTSWFVSYTFRRPLPPWREIEQLLGSTLRMFRDYPYFRNGSVPVTDRFRLRFTRATKVHRSLFVLGGWVDHDSGGFVISEMRRNLHICITEKAQKVSKVQNRYPEWWLALDDRIGYGGLDEADRTKIRELIQVDECWSKVILVNPLKPSRGFAL